MKKTILAMALLLALLFSLAACASEPASPNGSVTPSGGQNAAPTPGSTPDGGDDQNVEPEEPVEIEYWILTGNVEPTDETKAKVEALINEVSEQEINVHVNISFIPTPDYANQLNLAIANKEVVDLAMYTFMGPLAMFTSSNAAMDITDLVDAYGPAIKETMGDLLANVSYSGRLYGVPVARNYNSDAYIAMRLDVLESIGMQEQFENMATWAEWEEIMQAVKEQGETYAIGGGENGVAVIWSLAAIVGPNMSDSYYINNIGDNMNVIACTDDGQVYVAVEDPGIVSTYKALAAWYQAGYIYPDSAYTGTNKFDLVAAKTFASYIANSEYGYAATASSKAGTPMAAKLFAIGPVNTGAMGLTGAFVPSSAAEPEAAVKFLNLMYANADVMNALIYGVEGENYVLTAEGEAAYPEGVDASACGYRQNDFFYGNNFLAYPIVGNGGDFRVRAMDNFLTAPVSKYGNANVDLSDYGTIVANLKTVVEEFRQMMASGLYTDQFYAEYLSRLDAAGIDTYVELFQSAINEYQA